MCSVAEKLRPRSSTSIRGSAGPTRAGGPCESDELVELKRLKRWVRRSVVRGHGEA